MQTENNKETELKKEYQELKSKSNRLVYKVGRRGIWIADIVLFITSVIHFFQGDIETSSRLLNTSILLGGIGIIIDMLSEILDK